MKDNLKILLMDKIKWSIILNFFVRFSLILITLIIMSPHSTLNAQGTQDITIAGVVTDKSTGETLPGVNVTVVGAFRGAVTNLSGNFTIVVPDEESRLSFSFVGYKKAIVTVGKQRVIAVSLESDATDLEEVVVVGYGEQKKESIVGAISQTKGDVIVQTAQGGDLAVALTGALPGLITVTTTGLPGGSGEDDDYALLFIRGKKTWNNSSPLVLVDGVERPLNDVNPYEIKNISVLKDASATAVFGVKGANGVILITTLRGKEGKAKFSINARTTAKTISRIPTRELSYTGNLMKNYAILNELPISAPSWNSIVPDQHLEYYRTQEYPEYLPSVDWVDEFTKDFAIDKTVNMTLTGGTKFVKYFGSLAYFNESDILEMGDQGQGYDPSFGFDRLNFRSNMDFDITSTTRLSVNLSGFHSDSKRPGGSKYAGWKYLYSAPPDIWPAQYSDGTWANSGAYEKYSNGIYEFNFFGANSSKTTNVTTDFLLDQKLDFITEGLSFNARLSYDNTAYSSGTNVEGYGKITKWISPDIVDYITPGMTDEEIKDLEEEHTTYMYPEAYEATGYDYADIPDTYSAESSSTNVYRSLFYQVSLNYKRDFGKSVISGLALMNRQERAKGNNFPSFREDWVGRITYEYDRRYLLEFNGAYNGSEKFSKDYRFGFFPSMAAGWVVSNERFFSSIKPVMNLLKFRYSNGVVGSDEGIARWLYVGSWEVSSDVFQFGQPQYRDAYPLRYEGVIPNPDIQWETSHKQDFGIETGFFSNRLRLTMDYFKEERTDIFITGNDRVLPQYIGVDPVSANLGRVDMQGWEIETHFSHTTGKGVNYWASWAWSYSVDKILERGDPISTPEYQKQAGYQIDQPREILNQELYPLLSWNDMYNTVQGTSNSDLLPGDFARIDYNSDGIINENDLVPVGYPPRPQYSYAPAFGMSYKNFSTSARLYGVYNIEGSIGTYRGAFADQFTVVYPWHRETSWSPEFENTSSATNSGLRWITKRSGGYVPISRSYLKLQHAEVAYNLTAPWLNKAGFESFRLTLSVDNILLWTHMSEDLDADRPTSQTNLRRTYPKMTRYTFGIIFNFK